MKKIILTVSITGFIMIIASMASAEGKKGTMMCDSKEGKGSMMGKEMMAGGMMMHQMMEKTVLATPDGGIIVAMGNKLFKYDKDLNLVKEVELKMDMDSMKKMCPIMGKGKKGNENDEDENEDGEQAEHKDHHKK